MSRTCRKYSNAAELGMAVLKSLMAEARIRPRIGWVRADQARSEEDFQRERKLSEELEEARGLVEKLQREIRDRRVLADEVPKELLAQGSDICEFSVTFQDNDKKHVSENVELTWDEVFRVIGPSLYGYIVRKQREVYNERPTYSFQNNLEERIRAKIIDRAQSRKIRLQSSQIDACVLQFKEARIDDV